MRFVVIGAGAIGGVVAAGLQHAGEAVVAVARGEHLEQVRRHGLRVESPAGVEIVQLETAGRVDEVDWRAGDIALLAVKSQHTVGLLDELAGRAPAGTPIVCLQNGVANERAALRRFPDVQAVHVVCPATHLEPGVVQAWSSPVLGMLDLGRFPSGTNASSDAVAAACRAAGFDSKAQPDIWRWKLRKLVNNLANVVEVVCGPGSRRRELVGRLRAEGEEVLTAAGLAFATAQEDRDRRDGVLQLGAIEGRTYAGGSSWQSVRRGTGNVETDYLNGEIVLLGRLHGVPTPANELMQRYAHEVVRAGAPPGSVPEDAVLAALDAIGGGATARAPRADPR